MSSFTSKTVRDLYEVYSSVYVDETELFLNDVLDTVAESVNKLVNEGYDLSDYSWDEIYESFLENVLEPELQEVESFITQLNESAEELTEEQIENLLHEKLGFLSGLGNLFKGRQAVQTATQTATRAPKPSIIQAPPVRPGTPTPSSNPLYAPGVSSGRPTRPSVTPPRSADPGSFERLGNWLSNLTSKGRAQQAAKPTATTPVSTPSPKPTATTPASRQPSGTPQRQQGWPSIGLRDTVGRVTRALTPGPKVKGVAKGLLKYGVAPTAAAVAGTGGLLGGAIDVKRAASGQSSVTQRLGGATVGGIGNLAKTAASVAAATPGIKDTGTPRELQQTGQYLKNIGSNIQKDVDVKRAKELRAQPSPSTQPRRRNVPPASLTQSFEMPGNIIDEEPKFPTTKPKSGDWSKLTVSGVTKIWDPKTNSYQLPGTINKRLKSQGEKLIKVPGRAPVPAKPKMPGLPPSAAQPGTGPQGNKVGSKPPAPPVSPAPDSEPATTKPKSTPKPPAPAPTPFGKSVPAPAAADLDKYKINKDWAAANPRLAQAQVARASGQPRADINKILYKPGTAAYGASGKSEMENQVDQMRKKREEMAKQREADKIGPRAQSALPGGAYSPAATANMTQRTRNILGVKEQYDAYDLVLEYLFSQGHVDTVDEAHYVMMEMPAETIQGICEAAADQSNTQIDKGVKTTYKAQNVIDNQHQGRSRGLNRLPTNERAAKTKRMQDRLRARRDDLFGERNRREDERREKLKKMLGS